MADRRYFQMIGTPNSEFLKSLLESPVDLAETAHDKIEAPGGEFVSSNGPWGGLVAIRTLVTTHLVLPMLSFEIARLYNSYDYVSFVKVLLNRGFPPKIPPELPQ